MNWFWWYQGTDNTLEWRKTEKDKYHIISLICGIKKKDACMLSHFILVPTLCSPMDYSLLGSSVHWVLQARILDWVAMPFFRGSSQPRDWTCISYISSTSRRVLCHYCHLGSLFTVWKLTHRLLKTKLWLLMVGGRDKLGVWD